VIESLQTESQLRAVFNVSQDGPLPSAIVQSQLDNRRSIALAPPGAKSVAAANNTLTTSDNATEDNEMQRWTASLLKDDTNEYDTLGCPDNGAEDSRKLPAPPNSAAKKNAAAQSLVSLGQTQDDTATSPPATSPQLRTTEEVAETSTATQGNNMEDESEDAAYLPTSEDADDCSNTRHMWLNTLFNSGKVTTAQDLIDASLRSTFAIVDCDEKDNVWRRVIIRKKRQFVWTVIDEFGEAELDNITATDDSGPIAQWGQLYKPPSKRHFNDAKQAANKRKDLHDANEEDLNVSPTRKKMREDALNKQMHQGRSMKLRAQKVAGEVEEGSIVQIPLADVDRTKVDGGVLTLVVVEVVRYRGNAAPKYRLACAKGPLIPLYDRSSINLVPHGSRLTLGLDNVYKSWRGLAKITERTAASSTSMVGGQGKKIRCGCKVGNCMTRKCACFVAKRICGSHCHGGLNKNCINCNDDKFLP